MKWLDVIALLEIGILLNHKVREKVKALARWRDARALGVSKWIIGDRRPLRRKGREFAFRRIMRRKIDVDNFAGNGIHDRDEVLQSIKDEEWFK